MVLSFSCHYGLLFDILGGFVFVGLNKDRSQIALSMLTAINKSNNMIALPSLTSPDFSTRSMASAPKPIKHPKANAFWNGTFMGLSYPFWNLSHGLKVSVYGSKVMGTLPRLPVAGCSRIFSILMVASLLPCMRLIMAHWSHLLKKCALSAMS